MTLFLAAFLSDRITGGVSSAYGSSFEEFNMYEVRIENTVSKVITTMTVMARSEKEAKDNVYLNGWTVVGIKLLTNRVKDTYTLSTESVHLDIPKKVELENGLSKPIPAPVILDDLDKPEKVRERPAVKMDKPVVNKGKERPIYKDTTTDDDGVIRSGNRNVADNLNLLPDSPELIHIMTIYFKSGEVTPVFTDEVSMQFNKLPLDKKYVLFGNADDVKVSPNASYGSNYELSFLRAEHVKQLLVEKGANPSKINTVGLGTKYPVAKNTEQGNMKNRRVEIYGFRTQG